MAAPTAKAAPKRRKAGRIDLDERIEAAKVKEQEAKAALKKARNDAKNEKKKRGRLVRKAAGLSVDDLERIAKLKRAGLWDPSYGVGVAPGPPGEARPGDVEGEREGVAGDDEERDGEGASGAASSTSASSASASPAVSSADAPEEPEALDSKIDVDV
jgi:hypothetical protein